MNVDVHEYIRRYEALCTEPGDQFAGNAVLIGKPIMAEIIAYIRKLEKRAKRIADKEKR